MNVENIRENYNVAHMNVSGDVVNAARWIEKHHDEIIGFLLETAEMLRRQLNKNCLERDSLLIQRDRLQVALALVTKKLADTKENSGEVERVLMDQIARLRMLREDGSSEQD